MFHFHKCFAVKAETFFRWTMRIGNLPRLSINRQHLWLISVRLVFSQWNSYKFAVAEFRFCSFIFSEHPFQHKYFCWFSKHLKFQTKWQKNMLRLCHLVGVFFSLLFPPTWHKNLFTFHFLMYTPPSTHSIGSILFEKKENKSTAYQWLKRKRLGTHSGFLIDAFTPFDLWKRA